MSNHPNEQFLEDKFEQAIELGKSDDQAEQFAWSFFNEGPEGHIDPNEDLQPGECICGTFKCKDEYVHWTSGW